MTLVYFYVDNGITKYGSVAIVAAAEGPPGLLLLGVGR